ncbi:MAG: ATP-binding protein [Mycobacteriales bacterium]
MTFSFLGPDPLEDQLLDVLARLAAGHPPDQLEVAQVDVKEEAGRRGRAGLILPGAAQNDQAARLLAGEMACLANTPGGGAIVLGIANDGTRIGTELDSEWLRYRIWQLTESRLTVAVRVADLDGTRILVLTTHEAIEPIRHEGRLRWRVGAHCIEVDATTWYAGKVARSGLDWSAQPSGHALDDVRPVAVEFARRYLRAAGDEAALDLASASDQDLLRRLSLVDGNGRLTNAGSLMFVGTPEAGIDYIRRDVPGGDSTNRIRSARPLLEQVWEVDQASQASNRLVHVPEGFAHGQLRAIPGRAVREAIVNGVVHRDWLSPEPTTVEHVGDVLTVTSPGGFIGGIAPSNIITHPAVPRYRSLAEAMATLRLAEREGIGVDRMVRDMLAIGRPEPEISEIAGPWVRVGLLGGEPDSHVIEFLARVDPAAVAADVDVLLLVDHLSRHGWVDATAAAPVLQRPAGETEAAIGRLAVAQIDGEPAITPVKGVPRGQPAAFRLTDAAGARLAGRLTYLNSAEDRRALILEWAMSRGRISSTEAADLVGLSIPYAGTLLTALEAEGLLDPGRENKLGRGFYYTSKR